MKAPSILFSAASMSAAALLLISFREAAESTTEVAPQLYDPPAELKSCKREFRASDYFRMSSQQLLTFLPTSPRACDLMDDTEFRRVVLAARNAVRDEYETINDAFRRDCGQIGRQLYKRYRGRQPKIEAATRRVEVIVNRSRVYLTETEFPHLFVFKDEVADLPRELSRRIVAAARAF